MLNRNINMLILTGALLICLQQVEANFNRHQQTTSLKSLEECFNMSLSFPIVEDGREEEDEEAPMERNKLCSLYCKRNFGLLKSSTRLSGRHPNCCCQLLSGVLKPEVDYQPAPTTEARSMSGAGAVSGLYAGDYFAGSEKLEQPFAMSLGRPVVGPGVDLVAFNRRRFELDHRHEGSSNAINELRRSELIETKVATIPERLLSNLPPDLNKQIFESLSTDPTLMVGPATMLLPDGDSPQDPDGASVERLTKSCLTVHASSSKPEQLNVTFHLYTKNNPHVPFIIRPQMSRLEMIKNSPLQLARPIKWITHGFHTNVDKSEWMVEAKDKILAFEDANVILTDWRRGASPTLAFYPKAAANAHVVAKLIVKILRRLKNDIEMSRVHLIGHSLGAHIMGFVGSAFTEEYLHQQQQVLSMRTTMAQVNGQREPYFWQEQPPAAGNQLIGRITACDPALPCFGPTSSSPASQPSGPPTTTTTTISSVDGKSAQDWTPTMWTHLRPDSAIVVEVMHSNPGVMGYSEPLGDFDFFPNGFEKQPGCGVPEHEIPMQRHKRQLAGLMGNIWGSLAGSQRSNDRPQPVGQISQTLDKFIKPIRDFFHGYTCSHHRSVEYMVESMYYERIPQDRKLDRDYVCHMVGYRCTDYQSFKRGFCFKCASEHDCRAFTMPGPAISHLGGDGGGTREQARANNFAKRSAPDEPLYGLDKFKPSIGTDSRASGQKGEPQSGGAGNSSANFQAARKRVLPTFNHFNQNYLPARRNLYYFDTKPFKDFCLHHYHLLIKYRWFRVRDNVALEGLVLVGTLANITLASAREPKQQQQSANILLNRHTYQTYTMLLTEPVFLGQIEALVIVGDRLKSSLVEYAELTYMSNVDPRIRALGSARLCRRNTSPLTQDNPQSNYEAGNSQQSLFVRCSGPMM